MRNVPVPPHPEMKGDEIPCCCSTGWVQRMSWVSLSLSGSQLQGPYSPPRMFPLGWQKSVSKCSKLWFEVSLLGAGRWGRSSQPRGGNFALILSALLHQASCFPMPLGALHQKKKVFAACEGGSHSHTGCSGRWQWLKTTGQPALRMQSSQVIFWGFCQPQAFSDSENSCLTQSTAVKKRESELFTQADSGRTRGNGFRLRGI